MRSKLQDSFFKLFDSMHNFVLASTTASSAPKVDPLYFIFFLDPTTTSSFLEVDFMYLIRFLGPTAAASWAYEFINFLHKLGVKACASATAKEHMGSTASSKGFIILL
jgi:hypothetical protein